jgi:hypothetical protein
MINPLKMHSISSLGKARSSLDTSEVYEFSKKVMDYQGHGGNKLQIEKGPADRSMLKTFKPSTQGVEATVVGHDSVGLPTGRNPKPSVFLRTLKKKTKFDYLIIGEMLGRAQISILHRYAKSKVQR